MHLESTAFVLRTYPLRESDRIVALFSRAEGVLRGVAPRAGASRKRFGGTLSVLNEVEFAYHEKEGRDLGRLDWCRLLQPTPGEGRDLDAFYAACYMAEILEQMAREREADEKLYRLTRSCAAALESGVNASWVTRYFEIWTLRLGGLLPELVTCGACGIPLVQSGACLLPEDEAVCGRCCGRASSSVDLSPEAVVLVRRMLTQGPGQVPENGAGTQILAAVARVAAAQFAAVVDRPFRTAALVAAGRAQKIAGPAGRKR